MSDHIGRVALLWRGDRQARTEATPHGNRYYRVFEELAALGIHAEPAIYAEEMADEVRAQLLGMDGVLVWVDPLSNGRDRRRLDPLLRDVATAGVWVSAHPDVILKMGVKEILHRTKHFGWGTDTYIYRDAKAFRAAFPERLRAHGPRVIKQNRGNAGQGVWRVELTERNGADVAVLEARRGSEPAELPLNDFITRCEDYFANDGLIVDQPYQERLRDGMIRCYMGTDKVVGFGHQFIEALLLPATGAEPGPRIMHPATAPQFQALRTKMDAEWTPDLMRLLALDRGDLPIIWDADFLYGPRTPAGDDTFVLCEINVSSVFAIPDQAPAAIAALTRERLLSRRTRNAASRPR